MNEDEMVKYGYALSMNIKQGVNAVSEQCDAVIGDLVILSKILGHDIDAENVNKLTKEMADEINEVIDRNNIIPVELTVALVYLNRVIAKHIHRYIDMFTAGGNNE